MLSWQQRAKTAPIKAFGIVPVIAASITILLSPTLPAGADDPNERGQFLFSYQGCIDCHGPNAEGDVGPKISGLAVSFDEFLSQLRTPREQMDAYPPELLSDDDAAALYSFLQSLQN